MSLLDANGCLSSTAFLTSSLIAFRSSSMPGFVPTMDSMPRAALSFDVNATSEANLSALPPLVNLSSAQTVGLTFAMLQPFNSRIVRGMACGAGAYPWSLRTSSSISLNSLSSLGHLRLGITGKNLDSSKLSGQSLCLYAKPPDMGKIWSPKISEGSTQANSVYPKSTRASTVVATHRSLSVSCCTDRGGNGEHVPRNIAQLAIDEFSRSGSKQHALMATMEYWWSR
mmetsp:Transcript_62668/g.204531  ORF Transcript_62668/g.204531 Transcript_62668/m.204531 type:complete len:227 (-) Transcript_62668:985-1665(-)